MASNASNARIVSGVFKSTNKGGGVLLDPAISFQMVGDDPIVPAALARQFGLVDGAAVTGEARDSRQGIVLERITTIAGGDPAAFKARPTFARLVAVDPHERFNLGINGDTSMRAVDLVAPIGKGTRGLIVAPPKAGKTIILQQIAAAIHANDPNIRIIVLLLDERPEEVTHFRRSVPGQVLASSNDQSTGEHVALAELTLAHIRTELETGHDVVVLVDSLTRMARAFNLHGAGSRRTLTGGVDAAALEMPRRFFGLARKIERGGSVTVIATALVGTGSAMDDLIFEEFKSTGNSEIVLDRELAEARIFPAINLLSSGTRREDLLYGEEELTKLATLRRWLAKGSPRAAMTGLLKLFEQFATNDELLAKLNATRG
jgi:transcription termination factor Rho